MAAKNKVWWKSKTVWIAIIQFLIAVLAIILDQLKDPELTIAGVVLAFKSIVDIWMRFMTNTKLKLG